MVAALIALGCVVGCASTGAGRAGKALPKACTSACQSSFGLPLGEVDGVVAYSNCSSACVNPEPTYARASASESGRGTYTGIQWQCVEYARRWWLIQKGVVFGSVDIAADIWTLVKQATRPLGGTQAVTRHPNGGLQPPQRGDLLIYNVDPRQPDLRFGHVAVVVAVDPVEGWIAVAEQNWSNRAWTQSGAARRLELTGDNRAGYRVEDRADPKSSALIVGWIRVED